MKKLSIIMVGVLLMLLNFPAFAQDARSTIAVHRGRSIATVSAGNSLSEMEGISINEPINLNGLPGWSFQPGSSHFPEESPVDSLDWRELTNQTPYLELQRTDKAGTWFRLLFKVDSTFQRVPVFIQAHDQGIYYLYLDDVLLGLHGKRSEKTYYRHEVATHHDRIFQIQLQPGKVHELKAFLPVDFVPGIIRANAFANNVPPGLLLTFNDQLQEFNLFNQATIFWESVILVIALLFWLLYFMNPEEKVIALAASGVTLQLMFLLSIFENLFSVFLFNDHYRVFFTSTFLPAWVNSIPILVAFIFTNRVPRFLYISFVILLTAGILGPLLDLPTFIIILTIALPIVSTIVITIQSRRTIHGPQRIILVGLFITIVLIIVFLTLVVTRFFSTLLAMTLLQTAYVMAFPLTLLVYIAVRFRYLLFDTRKKAEENIRLAEAKVHAEQANQRILADQNRLLETEVQKRTVDLEESLRHLKSTQSQLVQSEKMASLGELTAGIAHEIQNPLNFVNNFSEVNTELISELKDAATKGNLEEVKSIASTLEENENKIVSHGKRADAIVKGMLQHSRKSSGQKEATDINALCDEYLRLSYHGLRAKDKSFNAKYETQLDPTLSQINVVPQDIGRVILNLINNAFYAVSEKKKAGPEGYEPTVRVATRKIGNQVEIAVADNGNGIPSALIEKIFQPFFTTKPTGQGTGLGLSLAYDIVTKGHGGELKVESTVGDGTTFTIQLSTHA